MKEEITKAIEILKAGGLILYPTDTVWGIGCDATNKDAVEKIYALKKSVNKKGMLILVDSLDRAACCVKDAPDIAWELMEVADKPLTLILDNAIWVASNLIPDEGTIGIRLPKHDFCSSLLNSFKRPLVSTSANISGEVTPASFEEISSEIKNGVDMVINPRFATGATGNPSTIIKVDSSSQVKVIRP